MTDSFQTSKTKINPNNNVNDDSLSENNKQMYDLCCFVLNTAIRELNKNNSTNSYS